MSIEVEHPSNHTQTTATVASSVATASGSKISKFATKSGFVIPKNKLSGSLVPIFRGGRKGSGDSANEESTKQVQRKTKWGPDLTQDTAVRKGRALAYQTRVDQIMQQLRLGTLETEDNQDSSSASQIQDHKSSDHQRKTQELEFLELERHEAIGEILKLNPSYKAPADYKPLLKEANVPIPIKDSPAYSVVGLFFGPASDTQKRLEKETGAKVRVYGTKADSGEKVEVTTFDGNEMHGGCDELHVHVSADTYEKVDAAVALIELLVTPVSENPASVSITSVAISGDYVNSIARSQGTPSTNAPAVVVSGGVAQPIVGFGPAPLQNHFQHYAGPWFPPGATHTPVFPSSGFAPPANPSAPLISNPVQVSPSPVNPSTMPSIFGPRPVATVGFSPVPQNPSLVTSGSQVPQVLQRPFIPQPLSLGHSGAPRNLFMPVSQTLPIQSNITSPVQLSANQPTPSGGPLVMRPVMTSLPQSSPPATFCNQPSTSAGWSFSNPTSIGPGNMIPVAPAVPGLQGHPSAGSQPSGLQPAGAPVHHPINVPFFNSSSHSQLGLSPSLVPSAAHRPSHNPSSAIAPIQPLMPQVLMPNSSPNVVPGSIPLLSQMTTKLTPPPPQSGLPSSGSGGAVSFNPINPPLMTTSRPQQPSSSDFTFQPHRPLNPSSEVVHRPNSGPIIVHPNQSVQPPQGSQTPSFRPAMHNLNHPPIIQGFSRPNVGNQMMQPTAQTSVNFASSTTAHPGPIRHATFPSLTGASLMQPMNFNSAPPFVNALGNPRAGGPIQIQQNYPASATRPQSFVAPNQFNSNMPFQPAARPPFRPSGVQQVYDPFFPTSVSLDPQFSGTKANMQKQESDPEYEDLMASVGVK